MFLIKLFPQHCVCAKPYFAARTGNTEDKELKGEDGWAVLASSQLTHFPLQAAPAEHRDFSLCMSDQQSVLPEGVMDHSDFIARYAKAQSHWRGIRCGAEPWVTTASCTRL